MIAKRMALALALAMNAGLLTGCRDETINITEQPPLPELASLREKAIKRLRIRGALRSRRDQPRRELPREDSSGEGLGEIARPQQDQDERGTAAVPPSSTDADRPQGEIARPQQDTAAVPPASTDGDRPQDSPAAPLTTPAVASAPETAPQTSAASTPVETESSPGLGQRLAEGAAGSVLGAGAIAAGARAAGALAANGVTAASLGARLMGGFFPILGAVLTLGTIGYGIYRARGNAAKR